MAMDQNIINFIIRKISVIIYVFYRFYNIIKTIKYEKTITSLTKLFQPIVFLFLVFSYTHHFNLDLFDKTVIFIVFPILFLAESFLFFKGKKDKNLKEKVIYIIILISFLLTELLYILKY